MLHLAEDINPETGNHDSCDIDSSSTSLNSLEYDEGETRDDRCIPRDKSIDDSADEWGYGDTEHPNETEQTNHESLY